MIINCYASSVFNHSLNVYIKHYVYIQNKLEIVWKDNSLYCVFLNILVPSCKHRVRRQNADSSDVYLQGSLNGIWEWTQIFSSGEDKKPTNCRS